MPLRPILKRSPPTPSHRPCLAVHFPPTPSIATHTFALSSATYDRSPIVVLPNSCALPERGCPGRTYTLEEEARCSLSKKVSRGCNNSGSSRERHPRGMLASSQSFRDETGPVGCSTDYTHLSLPALIPDLSSESDESDSFLHTPLEPSAAHVQHDIHGLAIPQTKYQSMIDQRADDPAGICAGSPPPSALSFLPHPPSPPSRNPYDYSYHDDYPSFPFDDVDESSLAKPRRRREKKYDSARAPDRIPSEKGDALTLTGSPPQGKRDRMAAMKARLSGTQSGFRIEEDGCLGGF